MHAGPRMWTTLHREAISRGVLPLSGNSETVSHAELAALPQSVRRYLGFFGIDRGTPKTRSFAMEWTGRFRLGLERPWMSVRAAQMNTASPIARLFHMKARMNGIVPVLARDTYVAGHGQLLAKAFGLVRVADGRGPEFDQSELVTWLNDAVFLVPTMLLRPNIRFHDIGKMAFDVELDDGGCIVRARIFLDDDGSPIDFETTDRFLEDPIDPRHPLVRGKWRTPIDGWMRLNGHPVPARGKALWRLGKTNFVYIELEPAIGSLAYDVDTDRVGRSAHADRRAEHDHHALAR